MILSEEDNLSSVVNCVAMVDGGFDPLRHGHIEYFNEASKLDAPLLCCLAPDKYVSKKHPILLPQADRAKVIDCLKPIDYVFLSQGTTADALRKLRPRYYVKGSDWISRIPDIEAAICRELDIEIVYLDTVIVSSSELIENILNSNIQDKDKPS